MFRKKEISVLFFVIATVLAPSPLDRHSAPTTPKSHADGSAPPPPLPWRSSPSGSKQLRSSLGVPC